MERNPFVRDVAEQNDANVSLRVTSCMKCSDVYLGIIGDSVNEIAFVPQKNYHRPRLLDTRCEWKFHTQVPLALAW